jgi:hypothetical protein
MTRDEVLIAALTKGGIVQPAQVLTDSREADLTLTDAATLLTIESGGGRNVFGHDRTNGIPDAWKGQVVTPDRYVSLRWAVDVLDAGSQGVGPCQLTYRGFQLAADALGGCWVPTWNRRVGFDILAKNIVAAGTYGGYGAYNGGPSWETKSAAVAYAKHAADVRAGWRDRIHDALDAAGY